MNKKKGKLFLGSNSIKIFQLNFHWSQDGAVNVYIIALQFFCLMNIIFWTQSLEGRKKKERERKGHHKNILERELLRRREWAREGFLYSKVCFHNVDCSLLLSHSVCLCVYPEIDDHFRAERNYSSLFIWFPSSDHQLNWGKRAKNLNSSFSPLSLTKEGKLLV